MVFEWNDYYLVSLFTLIWNSYNDIIYWGDVKYKMINFKILIAILILLISILKIFPIKIDN
jgi:hypothetical protein